MRMSQQSYTESHAKTKQQVTSNNPTVSQLNPEQNKQKALTPEEQELQDLKDLLHKHLSF